MRTLHLSGVPPLFQRLYVEAQIDRVLSAEDFARGLRDIWGELQQLAFDAYKARERNLTLVTAVTDPITFPHLWRFHVLMQDVLRWPLPESFAVWYRALLRGPLPASADEMMQTLVTWAANDPSEVRRALWHFLLVECVHLGLMLMRHWNLDDTACAMMSSSDLHETAEAMVDRWYEMGPPEEEGVRSFDVILHAAMTSMACQHALLHDALRAIQDHIQEEAALRQRIGTVLRDYPSVEHLILRNAFAGALGEQSLSLHELRLRHPDTLGPLSMVALEKRATRVLARFRREGEPHEVVRNQKHKPTLLSLLESLSPRTERTLP